MDAPVRVCLFSSLSRNELPPHEFLYTTAEEDNHGHVGSRQEKSSGTLKGRNDYPPLYTSVSGEDVQCVSPEVHRVACFHVLVPG